MTNPHPPPPEPGSSQTHSPPQETEPAFQDLWSQLAQLRERAGGALSHILQTTPPDSGSPDPTRIARVTAQQITDIVGEAASLLDQPPTIPGEDLRIKEVLLTLISQANDSLLSLLALTPQLDAMEVEQDLHPNPRPKNAASTLQAPKSIRKKPKKSTPPSPIAAPIEQHE